MGELIRVEDIQNRIYKIRGQSVMLDRDLAALYGMRSIALRQQVRRNRDHFPEDFAFQLTAAEAALLVSQSVIPSVLIWAWPAPSRILRRSAELPDTNGRQATETATRRAVRLKSGGNVEQLAD